MNTLRRPALWALAASLAIVSTPDVADSAPATAPRLTVIVVVDQLTAGRTQEWARKPEATGFPRLWQEGVVYSNAAFDHAATSTAPGHATIATGVQPSVHGIIANYWFDREAGRQISSVWDADFGVSPRQTLAPALADILHSASGGQGRIFSVSMKDRGAALTAGRHGKAFWYSKETGSFVTSGFYYPEDAAPQWLSRHNESMHEGIPRAWSLLLPADSYRYPDNRAYERPPKGWGREFPHSFAARGTPDYHNQLRYAPQGDRITLALALEIIERESLGQDRIPDLLSISLSATDRIGHAFGPNSREAEDNLHRLDRLLGELLDYLEERVGRGRFLLVLGSDHGVRPIPESVPGSDPQAARVFPLQLRRSLSGALRAAFKVDEDLVLEVVTPWVYLRKDRIEQNELDMESVRDAAIEWLEQRPGIARAIVASRLDDCEQPELCALIGNSAHPGRSGEIYLVTAGNSFFSYDPPRYAAGHGSPQLRDRQVPIIFYGMDRKPQVVQRPVTPRHIAPTLAAALGLQHQDNWEKPLREALAATQGDHTK